MKNREELFELLKHFSMQRDALKAFSRKLMDEGEISNEEHVFVMQIIGGAKYVERMYAKK